MSGDCDCCAGPPGLASDARVNRPGLGAIQYRLGTFGGFRQALLDELSRTKALEKLRSRSIDDYSVTSVEMWCAVADVLAFYSERIANEAFIRTATARDSVLRLARLIDYQLAPGTAAQTALAFTVEPGPPVAIPARTRVQSIPAQGEKPQKYETLEPITADARVNRLRLYPEPAYSDRGPFAPGNTTAYAAPDPAAVAAISALAAGDRVVVSAPPSAFEILTVADVTVTEDLVKVTWTKPITSTGLQATTGTAPATAYRLGRTFRLFGVDAPPSVVQVVPHKDKSVTVSYPATGFGLTDTEINGELWLDGRYDDVSPGRTVLAASVDGATVKTALLVIKSVDLFGATRMAGAVTAASATVTRLLVAAQESNGPSVKDLDTNDLRKITIYELVGDPLRFWPYDYPASVTSDTIYLPGARTGWSTIEVGRTIRAGRYTPGTRLTPTDLGIGKRVLLADGAGAEPTAAEIVGSALTGSDVTFTADPASPDTLAQLGLDAAAIPVTALASPPLTDPVQLPAQPALAVTIGAAPTQTVALTALAGAAKVAAVAAALQTAIRAALPADEGFARATVWADAQKDSRVTIFAAAGVPGAEVRFAHTLTDEHTVAVLGLDAEHARFADGPLSAPPTTPQIAGTVIVRRGLKPPQKIAVTVPSGSLDARAAALSNALDVAVTATTDGRLLFMPRLSVPADREWLRLTLAGLPPALDRDTAYLLGNVADASHGETIRDEILGDGDASQAFQRFALAKKPVTVLASPTSGASASSLQLFVNGEAWTEVPTLYHSAEADHVYLARIADDGTTTVEFGDGVHGARPATGRQNIVATYRQGSGIAGRVRAQSLRTVLDRATGVKSATNPLPGEGGSDAETLDNARTSAPGSVRTFGRAVSLLDFEDAGLTDREVAKARAEWVWAGHRRVVHLTIAGEGGATFTQTGLDRIAARFNLERDPNNVLLIDNYVPVGITVAATLTVDATHRTADVLVNANTAVVQAFAFEQRAFGEPVYLSEMYAILQHVTGVAGVDIDILDLKSADTAVRHEHGIDDPPGKKLQPQLFMLPARWSTTSNRVLPAELAVIEVPELDVALRAIGGISS